MSFDLSVAPDISEGLPALLSARETSETFAQSGVRFDVAIGGVAFLAATSDARPYVRQSASVSKQQFDSSKEAGEQTLDQFWLRSQTSWHRGAGIKYYEPGSDDATPYRFTESVGIDPWTKDSFTLLKRCTKVGPVAAGQVAYASTGKTPDGTDVTFTVENGVIRRRTSTASATITGVTASTRVAVAGTKILVGTDTAIAWGASTGSTVANLVTGAPAPPVPYWAKSRIIASAGASLYEMPMAAGTWPVDALFTHPDPGWTWTSIAESPSAILAAGYGGGQGLIYRFTLEDATAGSLPKLSQAYQIAEFPPGEEIHTLRVYLGAYLGIGTSKGLRVGLIDGQGGVSYGPLLIETQSPVRSLSARDSYLYAAVEAAMPDGGSGCVRVNLSEQISDMQFAWAWDAQTHTNGRVTSVAFLGTSGRVVLAVAGEGIYMQSATQYEPTGYLVSGRHRYGTVEQKSFERADLGLRVPGGSAKFSVIDPGGNELFIRGMTAASADSIGLSLRGRPPGTQEFVSFKVELGCSTDGLVAPSVDSLQIKAIPSPPRQRMVQYPLMCFDLERSGGGTPFGREGYAWQRVQALEAVENERATVQVQDFVTGETFDALVETIEFKRTGPRSGDNRPNFGGFLSVTVRRL